MTRRSGCLVTVAVGLVLPSLACGGGAVEDRRERAASEARAREPAPEAQSPETAPPLVEETVTLYFPSTVGDGLATETRQILHTAFPGDRAKQIISDLLAGPSGDSAASLVPAGTRLRQVYVLDDGTAYADFSEELRSGIEGGSDPEILTVYSIVNSLALNLPEIRRVAILVEGRECETLNGHLDLRRPLKPDRKLVLGEQPDAPRDDGGTVVQSIAPHLSGEV